MRIEHLTLYRGAVATDVKDLTKQAVDALAENEAAEVLDFIRYLRWRREEMDQCATR